MNWKKFLKPDWRKIVTFIFLFILIALQGIPVWEYPLCKIGVPCSKILYFISLNEFMISNQFWDKGVWLDWYILVIEIIFSYLLSYLIVWIYDKFKRLKSEK